MLYLLYVFTPTDKATQKKVPGRGWMTAGEERGKRKKRRKKQEVKTVRHPSE